MQMSNEEIVRRYKEAKDKAKQLGILSELNACDRQKIKDILAEGGIDHRQLPRSRKEKAADERTEKAERTKARPAKEKQTVQEKPVNTQCGGDNPTERPEDKKIYILEIVKQAVTEKMIQVKESMDQNAADLSDLNAFLKRFA